MKHFEIMSDAQCLVEVFKLYGMSFDDKNTAFDCMSGGYFREFKKAFYTLMMTDQLWIEDTLEIES